MKAHSAFYLNLLCAAYGVEFRRRPESAREALLAAWRGWQPANPDRPTPWEKICAAFVARTPNVDLHEGDRYDGPGVVLARGDGWCIVDLPA